MRSTLSMSTSLCCHLTAEAQAWPSLSESCSSCPATRQWLARPLDMLTCSAAASSARCDDADRDSLQSGEFMLCPSRRRRAHAPPQKTDGCRDDAGKLAAIHAGAPHFGCRPVGPFSRQALGERCLCTCAGTAERSYQAGKHSEAAAGGVSTARPRCGSRPRSSARAGRCSRRRQPIVRRRQRSEDPAGIMGYRGCQGAHCRCSSRMV